MAGTVKAYGLTFEEVLYELSYPNLILYNAVLPSYNPKKKSDSDNGQEVIKADDPRNKERVRKFFDSIE